MPLFENHCLKQQHVFFLPAVNSINHLSLAIIGLEWSYVPNPKLITGPAGVEAVELVESLIVCWSAWAGVASPLMDCGLGGPVCPT